MNQSLQTAKDALLAPAGIGELEIDQVFARLLAPRIDYADLYFQHARRESWTLEEGVVKAGSFGIEQGVGVRAVSGDKSGFAYSDELIPPALMDAARAARAIARDSKTDSPRVRIARRDNTFPAR